MALRAVLIVLILTSLVASGDAQVDEHPIQVLKDSKTEVTYYLKSDRRHVSAISSEGKLLWVCEVIHVPQRLHIDHIGWGDGDTISVSVDGGKNGEGTINNKTGIYSPPTVTQ